MTSIVEWLRVFVRILTRETFLGRLDAAFHVLWSNWFNEWRIDGPHIFSLIALFMKRFTMRECRYRDWKRGNCKPDWPILICQIIEKLFTIFSWNGYKFTWLEKYFRENKICLQEIIIVTNSKFKHSIWIFVRNNFLPL